MLDLLLACGNELVEARASIAPAWWMWSRDTTLGLQLFLGAPSAALAGVSIYRWARATGGLQHAAAHVVGAVVGLLLVLAAWFAPSFPPLALTPPLLLVSLRALITRLGSKRDARVKIDPPVLVAAYSE